MAGRRFVQVTLARALFAVGTGSGAHSTPLVTYQRMYETQTEWGEQQVPADDMFRGFTQDLGLDLTKYDQAYDDPATLERVKRGRTLL